MNFSFTHPSQYCRNGDLHPICNMLMLDVRNNMQRTALHDELDMPDSG